MVSGRPVLVVFSFCTPVDTALTVLASLLVETSVLVVGVRGLTSGLEVSLVVVSLDTTGVSSANLLYLSLKLVGVVDRDTEEMPPDATPP